MPRPGPGEEQPPRVPVRVGANWLESSFAERVLGCLADKSKTSQQCAQAKKANSKLGCSSGTAASRSRAAILPLGSELGRLRWTALSGLGLPRASEGWMDWSKTSGGLKDGLELEQVARGRRLKELGLLTSGKVLRLWWDEAWAAWSNWHCVKQGSDQRPPEIPSDGDHSTGLWLNKHFKRQNSVVKLLFAFGVLSSPQHVVVYVRTDESPEDLSPCLSLFDEEVLLFEDA